MKLKDALTASSVLGRRWPSHLWCVSGALLASAVVTLTVGASPAAAGDRAQALARPGRWEADGPGGARLAFVVIAEGERRFAGAMVALCGNQADLTGSVYSAELDAGGDAVISPGFASSMPSFALDVDTGVVSRVGDVRDRFNRVVCPSGAFRRLRARYVGPVYIPDGEWTVVSSLGAFGAMQTRGGGALVHDFVPFVGLSGTDPPVPCAVSPIGEYPNPVAGPSSALNEGGAFRREETVLAGLGPYPGEITVTGIFAGGTGGSAAVGLYDGAAGDCAGAGSWVAMWARPLPIIPIPLPGLPPIQLEAPLGRPRPGSNVQEDTEVLPGYFGHNGASAQSPRGFRSMGDALTGYQACRRLRSRRDCTSIPTLFVGADTPESRDHASVAIAARGKPALLHWTAPSHRAAMGWYRNRRACKGKSGGNTGKDCDEDPFRSTREDGPGASLMPIGLSDNRHAGARLAALYSRCSVHHEGRSMLVIPLPATNAITTVIACNGIGRRRGEPGAYPMRARDRDG